MLNKSYFIVFFVAHVFYEGTKKRQKNRILIRICTELFRNVGFKSRLKQGHYLPLLVQGEKQRRCCEPLSSGELGRSPTDKTWEVMSQPRMFHVQPNKNSFEHHPDFLQQLFIFLRTKDFCNKSTQHHKRHGLNMSHVLDIISWHTLFTALRRESSYFCFYFKSVTREPGSMTTKTCRYWLLSASIFDKFITVTFLRIVADWVNMFWGKQLLEAKKNKLPLRFKLWRKKATNQWSHCLAL